MSRDECVEYLEGLSIECRGDEDVATLRDAVFQNAKDEGLSEFCDDMRIDVDEQIEAFEHWAVTSYFAEKLAAKGHMTGDLLDYHVWGRPTTGQMISMDGVIRDIARDMEILYGQQNCWADASGNV